MTLLMDDFIRIFIAQLTEQERRECVAYAADRRLPAGTRIQFPGAVVELKTNSYVGFIDREPGANWGHPARYLIVGEEGSDRRSVEVRLPPFGSRVNLFWRLVYKAPSVPDEVLENPQ